MKNSFDSGHKKRKYALAAALVGALVLPLCGCGAKGNWQMQYCIWWIQGVNGDNYLMIFHPIQQYTVFIVEPGSAAGTSCKKDANKCRTRGESELRGHRFPKGKNGSSQRRTWNWRKEKTKSRKRHIVVDVLGCLLSVTVHTANIHDTKGGISTAKHAYARYPSIQKFCADAGYRGIFVSDAKIQRERKT